MKAEFRHLRSPIRRRPVAAVALAVGLCWVGGLPAAAPPEALWRATGKLADHPTYLVYRPEGLKAGRQYPLVFALSPAGDALAMIRVWAAVAEKHQWIIAASKEFHNGQEFGPSLKLIEAELNDVERAYAIDPARVIFTGISGGGMGSHAVAKYLPGRVRALVVNTGMMHATFPTADYPEGKAVVFLASPTDFRYGEMKRDRLFLEQHHWQVAWIEFGGGHTFAPAAAYEQAAQWLEGVLP